MNTVSDFTDTTEHSLEYFSENAYCFLTQIACE
jgi:hypothetical protein